MHGRWFMLCLETAAGNFLTSLQKLCSEGILKHMNKKAYGFTIVELLIVIVVIGILAAISIVAYNNVQLRARVSSTHADVNSNAKKIEQFRILSANDTYPRSAADLTAAGVSYSKGAYDHLLYCFSSTATWYAYIIYPKGSSAHFQFTPTGGLENYPGSLSTGLAACQSVNPAATGGVWISTT